MYNTNNNNVMHGRACGCAAHGTARTNDKIITTSCEHTGCGKGTSGNGWGLGGYPLASVYSPLQNFENLYDCENALIRGTIFKELDLPFVCGGMSGGAIHG